MDAIRFRPRFPLAPMRVGDCGAVPVRLVAVAALILQRAGPRRPPARQVPAARPLARDHPGCGSGPRRLGSDVAVPRRQGAQVGASVSAVAARLGRAAEIGRQEVDRGSLGERLTRFYEYGGSRFILVFEPLEPNGDVRVAAIYLP